MRIGVDDPLAGRQELASLSIVAAWRRVGMCCVLASMGWDETSLQARPGQGVVGDDPWFQISRGVHNVYITNTPCVNKNPLFDQLTLGTDIIHPRWVRRGSNAVRRV